MGRANLDGVLDIVEPDVALRWHLESNHYPPIPEVFHAAREAIAKASAGHWHDDVELPHGVTWRDQTLAPVHVCVEAWHLDGFLE